MISSKKDSEERHQRFVRQALDTQFVWGLQCAEGWCQAPSNHVEDARVMPFWSDRGLAAECAIEEWSEYSPTPVSLADFRDKWLPSMKTSMKTNRFLVGTNWTPQLIGVELAPELLEQEFVRGSGEEVE